MNLYKYWLIVKTLYPMATGDCIEYFIYHYPEDWRSHFKNPDEIAVWLEKRHVHILTRKRPQRDDSYHAPSPSGDYSFELKSPEETTTAFRFTSRESALYDAIERAFRILEQRELRRIARGEEPFSCRRKQKPAPGNGPTWQEQLNKK